MTLSSLRTLALASALLLPLAACGGGDDADEDDDDKPSRDSGSGSGVGSGSGGEEGGSGEGGGSGDEGGSGSGEGGGAGSGDEGSEAFRPDAGTWTYTGGNLLSDSCNTDEFGGGEPGASTFTLTHTGEGDFVMKYETGDPWRCSLTEQAFTCDPLAGSAPVEDYDVVIKTHSTHSGSFDSETDLYGEFKVDVDCQGSDCELAEWYYDLDFPCSVVFDATASFTG